VTSKKQRTKHAACCRHQNRFTEAHTPERLGQGWRSGIDPTRSSEPETYRQFSWNKARLDPSARCNRVATLYPQKPVPAFQVCQYNRCTSVSRATRILAGGIRVRFPAGERDFSSLQYPDRFWAHSASYSVVKRSGREADRCQSTAKNQ
jgi:hypothetical protein